MSANVFEKNAIVARETLLRLNKSLVFANLVYRDYESEYQNVGDTITIKTPSTFVAQDWVSGTLTKQYINETGQTLKLDKVPDITIPFTSIDWTLNIEDWSKQVLQPVADALALYVDNLVANVYWQAYWSMVVTSTATIQDFADLDKMANEALWPATDRNLVLSPALKAKYITLPAVMNAEKSGSTDALRRASLGEIMGFDTWMSQNIKTHVSGTLTSGNASGTEGAFTVAISSGSAATATLKAGDAFTIAGDTQVYVVTENAACTTSAIAALKIYPALATSPSNAAITLKTTAGANSLAFHKNAIALVVRPFRAAQGAPSSVVSMNGLSVRTTVVWDAETKSDQISFDFLCGVKMIDPRLAIRLVG